MKREILNKCWTKLLKIPLSDDDYWLKRNLIPVGSLEPFETYIDDEGNVDIPIEDVVTIPYDPIDIEDTSRSVNSVIIIGGSGDAKSFMAKNIWYFLQKAGWKIVYFDPIGTEASRGYKPNTKAKRLAPFTEPDGIPLKSYMPEFARDELIKAWVHNFHNYSNSLKELNSTDILKGAGMSEISAIKTANIVKYYLELEGNIEIDQLKNELFNLTKEELSISSFDNAMRIISSMTNSKLVSDEIAPINWKKEFKKVNSIVIHYNNCSPLMSSFDCGLKIKSLAQFNLRPDKQTGRRQPVMCIIDDPSNLMREDKLINFNLAVKEISNINFNYRKLAIQNILILQNLKMVDEKVVSSYKHKIISPMFQSIDQLNAMNIPSKAIQYLKSGVLVKDKQHYLIQWLYVDENNEVVPFFPFDSPSNHFDETLTER